MPEQALPYNHWIQHLCPSPRRHVQLLIVSRHLRSGLDIGCGSSSLLSPLRTFGLRTTGIDAFQVCVESARRKNLHDEYIVDDFRRFGSNRHFDVVVMSHVIEHFTREEGLSMLHKAETIATRLVYVETPRGYMEQDEKDGNPYQRHLSGWFPCDFSSRGYTVFGSGLRLNGHGWRGVPFSWRRALDRGLALWLFRRPDIAGTLMAIRLVDEHGAVCSV